MIGTEQLGDTDVDFVREERIGLNNRRDQLDVNAERWLPPPQMSVLATSLQVLSYKTATGTQGSLTPPQLSVLARSFPVPSGRTATGGGGVMLSASMTERIQPTVPSPPHAKIRRFGTFR